jgi:alanyl-tRNA synthetase
VPLLALQLKDVFPELHQQLDYVERVVQEEEISFLRTLEKGLKKIEGLNAISGEQAFELYDTYGFPFDLTSLIARERGFTVDEKAFTEEMAKQKARSRVDASKETGDWVLVGNDTRIEFVGYDFLESPSNLVKYRRVKQKNKELVQLVFDRTPFYAESGGQVGDTGVAVVGNETIHIIDTKKENELIIHFAEKLPSQLDGSWKLTVDRSKRRASMNNHSATHLLHAALRQVLGKHVEQKGSLVNDNILRFDFSHFAAMTPEELSRVETIVNQKIMENITLDEKRNVPIDKAKSLGAMALFGEKYGEFVRVITFDPKFSVELCGGTHVPATGNIGSFKILSESSVAAGVRRIEAVTGEGALAYFNDSLALLTELKSLLKNPKDVAASLQSLVEERHALEKKVEVMNNEKVAVLFDELQEKIFKAQNHTAIIERVSVPNADALKNLSFNLRNKFSDLFMVLAADIEGKPQISVMLGEQTQKNFNAVDIVKILAKEIDGGGGGQPFYATAGGKKPEGLKNVIEKAKQLLVN